MAITVTLYSFTKRENSTKQPSSGGTSYSCVLIDDTSLMNPTFKLEIGSNPIGKNYARVSDFDRYYFITEIRSYQGFWYISCEWKVNYPVLFLTEQTEGRSVKPYISNQELDMCADCIRINISISGTGAMGYNEYKSVNHNSTIWNEFEIKQKRN